LVKYNFKPCIIFFTGISASGKSTICKNLKKKLIKLGIKKIKYIDGDFFRKNLKNFNYQNNNRNKIGNYKISLAKHYYRKKYLVLVSGVAHNRKWRMKIKTQNKNYFEIYVKCLIKTCIKRDFKDQYMKAKSGLIKDFIGISEPYQLGTSKDLIVNTSRLSISMSVNKVMNFIIKKNYVYKK